MRLKDKHGIDRFLKDYPGMSISPSRSSRLKFEGFFSFSATPDNGPTINGTYRLVIEIPDAFPKDIPIVREIGEKIPHDGKHHVNDDGSLCLGSPIRLLSKISENPSLVGFSESCLVPFLYAISYKNQYAGDFIFDELAHGTLGILDDYKDFFGLKTAGQVINTLALLGTKKRIANKKPCPCNCGNILGKCSFHLKINRFRNIATRSWFTKHAEEIYKYLATLMRQLHATTPAKGDGSTQTEPKKEGTETGK